MWPSVYEERRPVLSVFSEALSLFYAGRFPDAAALFSDIENEDPSAARYRLKCLEIAAAPPDRWEGVWVMTSK